MHNRQLDRWLRRRVALICGLSMSAVLLMVLAAIYVEENVECHEEQDARLQEVGHSVLFEIEADPGFTNRSHPSAAASRNLPPARIPRTRWQVWSRDGALLLSNDAVVGVEPIVPLDRSGLVGANVAGQAYRVVSLQSHDNSFVVQAVEPDEGWWAGIDELPSYFHLAMLLPFGLILGVAWLMLQRTIESVKRLTDQLRRRDPLDPTRLDDAEHALAMQSMASALNELFDRMAQTTSVERSLSAAVAHEIRGSLAGIRAQAQLACAAQVPDERDDALALLMSGVDRAARMLDQVFDLARVNGLKQGTGPQVQDLDVARVCTDVTNEVAAKAEARGISLATSFGATHVAAIPPAFHMLLRNLLENAVLYCPAGGRIEIRTAQRMRETVLTVDDSGRGIPAADRELAFERFNRLGQRETVGVGLGLWIVKRIVELHGATIRLLDSPLGGLRVEVVFAASRLEAPASDALPTTVVRA